MSFKNITKTRIGLSKIELKSKPVKVISEFVDAMYADNTGINWKRKTEVTNVS